jgi:hypothetical protein
VRVEIVFENQPPMDLMSAKPGDPDIDWDFELNYLVAKDAPKPFRLPIRAAAAWARLHDAQPAEAPSVAAGIREKPCSGTHYSPSAEASVSNPKCPPVEYASSEEAGPAARPICPGTNYAPSGEAGMGVSSCAPVIFTPNGEASDCGSGCGPTILNPHPGA